MILVAGSTGLVGGQICVELAKAEKPVRALVRSTSDPTKVGTLKGHGVELAEGDLKDRSNLDAACAGVLTVVSTASSTLSHQAGDTIETVDRDGELNLVEAAKAAGARHFIFVSFPPFPEDFPLNRAKRAVEERLKESGMAHTILWPTFFDEVWLSPALGFDAANGKARVYGSGENKIRWISYFDVAAFAAACVDNPAARNKTIQLGGPEALSPLETVRIFEEESHRRFAVEHVREEDLSAQKAAATDSLSASFAGLMLSAARGDAIDTTECRTLFPSIAAGLTSVRDYAKRSVSA
jgi:NADH dehydrogenase